MSFKYISCYGSRFENKRFESYDLLFKYISCYGSRSYISIYLVLGNHLNTSHVMVQVISKFIIASTHTHLNTSHVMVQERKIKEYGGVIKI